MKVEIRNFHGTVTASSFSGNATSATKATQDGSGNTITSTYLKLSGGTMTGTIINNSLAAAKPAIQSNVDSSWIDGIKGKSAIYLTGAGSAMKPAVVGNSTNGRMMLYIYNGAMGAAYMNNTNINAGTNTMTKINTLCDESGNMAASGNMTVSGRTTTSSLTVNGKKVFIQKATPSGAVAGDIWIVTTS